MATSHVDIVNQALVKLGTRLIASFGEESKPARVASASYYHLRDTVLEAYPWTFALRRAELYADSVKPVFGPNDQFTLPADCLQLNKIEDLSRYKVEGDKILPGYLGDEYNSIYSANTTYPNPLQITYISRIEDVTKYSTLFIEALAARLTQEWAVTLRANDEEMVKTAAILYQDKVAEARSLDAVRGIPDDIVANDWSLSRRG
jgi:hypothetical protein